MNSLIIVMPPLEVQAETIKSFKPSFKYSCRDGINNGVLAQIKINKFVNQTKILHQYTRLILLAFSNLSNT